MEMRIEDGQLKFPPISKLPDGFDLFFQRRSLRKTYQYEDDGDMFTLTVCKDQSKEVNADQTDAYSFNESEAKVLLVIQKQFSTYMHFPDSNTSSPSGAILQEYHFFFVRTGSSVSSVSNYNLDTLNLTILWSIWRYICRIERLLL